MVELATRPTVVLIPGGWHPPSSYSKLTSILEHLSYPVVALRNPSLNSATKGLRDDITHVEFTLQMLVAVERKDVVVVSHSYGGLPAMVAVAGFEKIKRKELGEKGGVMGMLYMVTTALQPGISQIKAKTVDDWDYWPEDEANVIPPPKDAHQLFYSDLTPEEAAPYIAKLEPQGFLAFHHEMPPYNLDDVPSIYLACRKDNALLPASQERNIKLLGKRCTVEWCNTSHSPFVSRPELICDLIMWLGRDEMLE